MNKIRFLLIIVVILAALSLIVYSVSTMVQVTDDIRLEDVKDCTTNYWNETEHIYGNCESTVTERICEDTTTNTSCSTQERTIVSECIKETKITEKSKETCVDKELRIAVNKALKDENYRLNYEGWGKCSYSAIDETLMVICDSEFDGNGDGICQQGESCIAFIVEKGGTQRLVKNSRIDYVPDDVTFYQDKLDMEVAQ
jgi:hypothetical protein